MQNIKFIIDSCYLVLNIPINLFGYSISLWQFFLFGILVYVVVWIFFGAMK